MNHEPKQYFARARNYVDGLPASTQAVGVLFLLSLGVVMLVFAQADRGATDLQPLFVNRRLSSAEWQRVEEALGKAKLTNFQWDNEQIVVPSDQKSLYRSAVAAANCLQEAHSPTEEALQNSSILDLGPQRAARLHHAHEQEAGRALRSLHGIEEASVHFSEGRPKGIHGERDMAASVVVRVSENRVLDPRMANAILNTVLTYQVGLTPESVSITEARSGLSFRGSELLASESATVRDLRRHGLEQRLRERFLSVLKSIPEVQVTVQVEESAARATDDVRVSVNVPSSYVDVVLATHREAASSRQQVEEQTCRRVRSAIRPLLPGIANEQDALNQIGVTIVDDSMSVAKRQANNALSMPPQTVMLGGVIILAIILATLLLAANRRRIAEPPKLRVYSEPEVPSPTRHTGHPADSTLKQRLHELVDEDPEAAAKSLSDWIDRAS